MARHEFEVGRQYKREEVSEQVGDGGVTSGNWSTGYPQKDGVTFIFCNVGNAGQTGHDYDNFFDGPDLVWRGRTSSSKHQPSIKRLTAPSSEVHVFWRSDGRDPFTYAGLGQATEVSNEVPVRVRWKLSNPSKQPLKIARLPVSELNKVKPEHIWEAIQKLLDGETDHGFAASIDYDVIADDGKRLPPKAVFGIAAKLALGYQVLPAHFTAGLSSPCFTIIENAGFPIVAKNKQYIEPPALSSEDQRWAEGKAKLVSHLKRERSRGASQAKRSQFKQDFGKLFCEKCKLDPVEIYGTIHAESCIEVHHRETHVSDMDKDHATTLASLQCLCANCHRLEHKLLRVTLSDGDDSSQSTGTTPVSQPPTVFVRLKDRRNR